jgi:hypothetical protein
MFFSSLGGVGDADEVEAPGSARLRIPAKKLI